MESEQEQSAEEIEEEGRRADGVFTVTETVVLRLIHHRIRGRKFFIFYQDLWVYEGGWNQRDS